MFIMKAYSQDLRERVVRACDEGRLSHQQIAQLFHVSTAWIRRLLQRRRQTGSFAAKPPAGGPRPKLGPPQRRQLVALVAERPDATLAELRQRLGAFVHLSTIHRALQRCGLTVKKKVLHAAEHGRPDVKHKRACWRGRAAGIDPSRFVFLDEMGTHTAMTRLYGRAPRGERCVGRVPQAHWRTTTLLSAIRSDGLVTAWTFAGATGEAAFVTFIEAILVPTLRPGDLVVLDRLAAHRAAAVARSLRKAKAGVWYLPPYSPDFNPIEKSWAKVKAYLRKAEARSLEALVDAIAEALRAVTPEDCQHCFEACGYHATPVRKAL
jgi:transposase